ncbi:unnamed protein product [Rotaria sp. Silwood2]|nr:unnamed protein product [Rotaria sp. Silwood2]CAF4614092.1 unnamed protein product [Rotaria sp. Silwood2]CAF4756509.1 unnamed protein product [Rotaria sp. Silwood2]
MNSIFDKAALEFKAYTSDDIGRLKNTVRSMAERGKTRDKIADEEAAFVQPVNQTKNATLNQLDRIKERILDRRPGPGASDLEKEAYRKLLQYADEGMSRLRNWIGDMFSKLIDIVKTVVIWIWEHVDFIFEKIANAFKNVFDIFFK